MTGTIMATAIIGNTKLRVRFGSRPLVTLGMLLSAAGMLGLTQLGLGSSYAAHILPGS